MKNTSALRAAALLALGALTSTDTDTHAQQPAGGAAGAAPYRIAGVQAKLYYAGDATFSENVLDNPPFALYNVVIGEGSARAPSRDVLVLVEVAGPPRQSAGARMVELMAFELRQQRRVKLRRASRIGLIEDSGRTFVAFWLYDTGCVPLLLRVGITGQPEPSAAEKSLDFHCGE